MRRWLEEHLSYTKSTKGETMTRAQVAILNSEKLRQAICRIMVGANDRKLISVAKFLKLDPTAPEFQKFIDSPFTPEQLINKKFQEEAEKWGRAIQMMLEAEAAKATTEVSGNLTIK